MQILRLKLVFYASEGLGLLLGIKLHPVPPEMSNEAKRFYFFAITVRTK